MGMRVPKYLVLGERSRMDRRERFTLSDIVGVIDCKATARFEKRSDDGEVVRTKILIDDVGFGRIMATEGRVAATENSDRSFFRGFLQIREYLPMKRYAFRFGKGA